MRANLFAYREADDPWLREMRHKPVETMNAALPRLRRITGEYIVSGDVKIRPADLHAAPATGSPASCWSATLSRLTCPVSGTGADKVLTDVTQLCNVRHSGLACDRGHERGQDRVVLRGPGQAGLRHLVDGEGVQLPQGHGRRPRHLLARATAGALPGVVRRRQSATAAQGDQHGTKTPRSLLLVVILIIVVFIVVVGLTGRAVRPVAWSSQSLR